jgi:hypothetical protein
MKKKTEKKEDKFTTEDIIKVLADFSQDISRALAIRSLPFEEHDYQRKIIIAAFKKYDSEYISSRQRG